jgi:myosin heavy subunit
VVNPFRDLGNTSDKIIEQYKNAPDIFSLQPHVFRIARTAVENLNNFSKSQTILVSGDFLNKMAEWLH